MAIQVKIFWKLKYDTIDLVGLLIASKLLTIGESSSIWGTDLYFTYHSPYGTEEIQYFS